MKIVISPAKSLDMESKIPTDNYSQPQFEKKTRQIQTQLKELSPKQLTQLMGISEKLAELNWQRNQNFHLPFTPENARQAVYSFSGEVYVGLDVYTLSPKYIEKMQNSLRILSGLYGVIKPLDLIQAYRLEMGTKIAIGNEKDLYDFWKEDLTAALNKEIAKDELFINLASNEYFKAIDTRKLNATVITPIFKDWKGDSLKTISFFAKKARGLMARYLIENQIDSIEDIKGFNYEGYHFSQEHTLKPNEPVFVR
ncbi:peroxide stress protein YaaA [Capnocytophaga canimorsus]|uniref:peroxide stress protein YaaA n=1 Tax=Capnocytophaga canimorsus TaxID=28188 RepID=UPI0037CD46A6